MAPRKKAKMGADPLAWMKEGGTPSIEAVKKEPVERRSKPRTRKSKLGLNVDLLEETFNALAPQGEALVARFYEELFVRYPGVKPMFANTSVAEQEKKLLGAMVLVINSLRKPKELVAALTSLGAKHHGYGAKPEHYTAVAETLLDVMSEFAGDLWTEEVQEAWTEALNTVASTMLAAEHPDENRIEENNKSNIEDKTMAASKKDVVGIVQDSQTVARMQSAVDGAMTAIMMIDRDFNITYANKSTVDLLTKHEATLAAVYPGFKANALIGSCIDGFHKNPAHQRQLLSDPGNLPYTTDIQVGPLKFQLNVTAQIDSSGTYIGNTLEWADVTAAREQESNVTRLQGTVDGAMTCMMMIDRDFNITYANQSTIDLLTMHERSLGTVYPGFRADAIIGTCIDTFHVNPAHQRKLLDDPRNLPYSTDITVGELKFALNVTAIMDANGNYVGNALEWSDVTETRAKEMEVKRLSSAVDGAQANLMLCDADLNITYANPAVVEMLRHRQMALRQIWPGLDVDNLVGTCIDGFHRNPAHQRALLADASRLPAKAEMAVGDLEFEVNATMITGPNGEYMGNMVEWKDITEQKDAERQIETMIEGAVAGQLENRISSEKYTGFLKGLGEGINKLMDAVVEPVQESRRVISGLADGDLTQSMDGEFQGDFAELRDAVNSTMSKLLSMVGEIGTASGTIASAANEISQGTADLSQRSEEQASSLEETASSMEELTGTVKQNADNAREANQLASSARDGASKGGEVVGKAIEAMSEINKSSKQIADIIGVIDEIAFQTNLLALNAAVEAARAGEQGRGFAVVAAEVRNLAQRSASAAKEIKTLINESVEKVTEGSKLVDQSGETLTEIVGSVKKVSDIIAEIASASQEQASGIEQINKAVVQMDEMTQQNGALVEEAAASSEAMSDQATSLDELVGFFNTGEERARRSAPVANQRPASRPAGNSASAPRRPAAKNEASDSEWEEF